MMSLPLAFLLALQLGPRRLAEGSLFSKESFVSLVLLDLVLMEAFKSAPMIRMMSFGRLLIIFKTSLLNLDTSFSE